MIAICPAPEKLKKLSLGQLPEEQSDQLLVHLQDCETCQEEMGTIDSGEDTLVKLLRSDADDEDTFDSERECQVATARALAALAMVETDSQSSPQEIPQSIGEYEIVSPLGHGGMGHVYLGRHTKLGRQVAIKFISDHRRWDKNMHERFASEMRMIGGLNHRNIVHAHDAREVENVAVLVTEFIDGLDVSEIVKRMARLSVADACVITREVCNALTYIDGQGLVHRDIKPSNIMLSSAGQVKLLDLGLARLQDTDAMDGEFTATGQAIGTADYVAPEQINDGRNVDIRSDIYGLGCTLYKMLTGRVPFAEEKFATAFAKMNAHISETPEPITTFRDDLPIELVKLVHKMLEKDPAARPQTPNEVIGQLEEYCGSADLQSLVETSKASLSQASPRISETKSKTVQANQPQTSSFVFRRMPFIAVIAAGLAGVFLGLFLGIVLTIKRPDGTTTRVEIPDGSTATIDSKGNIEVQLPGDLGTLAIPKAKIDNQLSGAADSATHRNSKTAPATDAVPKMSFNGTKLRIQVETTRRLYDEIKVGDLVDLVALPMALPIPNQRVISPYAGSLLVGSCRVDKILDWPVSKLRLLEISLSESNAKSLQALAPAYKVVPFSHQPERQLIQDRLKMNGVWQGVTTRGYGIESSGQNTAYLIERGRFWAIEQGSITKTKLELVEKAGVNYVNLEKIENNPARQGKLGIYRFADNGQLEIGLSGVSNSAPTAFQTADFLKTMEKIESPSTAIQQTAFKLRDSLAAKRRVEFFLATKVFSPEAEKAAYQPAIDESSIDESSGQQIWLSSEKLIDNADLISAKTIRYAMGKRISLELTDEGAFRLWNATSANVGKWIATVMDGKVVSVQEIVGPIGKQLIVTGKFSREQLQTWVSEIVPQYVVPERSILKPDADSSALSKTAHTHGTDQGLCPLTVLSERNGPVAVFGVYKSKNDNPKFGYLILFQPAGERKEACQVTKTYKGVTSETGTDAEAELKWDDNRIEVAWNLTTDERTGRIERNVFKINGKTIDSNSRLLLAKRVGDKLEFTPVNDKMPSRVPNAASESGWTKEIEAAISELKSSSKDVAEFLNKK